MGNATSTAPEYTIVTARVETAQLDAFRAIAVSRDRTVSQELRGFIRRYIAEHAEGEAA